MLRKKRRQVFFDLAAVRAGRSTRAADVIIGAYEFERESGPTS